MMKKCVIYARQSSGDSDESESVENQKQKCLELTRKEHLEVVGIFDDLNTSGKTYPIGSEDIANLDIAFQKWFKEQTTKKMYRDGLGNVIKSLMDVDYIVCYDITRLYRPVTGSFLESHINQLLVIHGVKVWTVNNGIVDFEKFNDSLIMALQNRINHEQIAIQRKKAKEALKSLKDSGTYKSGIGCMHGFNSTGKKREIEVNPREAEMIKDVYKIFLETSSLFETTRIINQRYKDIFPEPIGSSVFRKILQRPIYCGYMYNSDGELIKNHQIDGMEFISFDDWKEVKSRFEKRKITSPRAKQGWYPLSGIIHCGICGGKMTLQISRKIRYYRCKSNQYQKRKTCGCVIHSSIDTKWGIGLLETIYPFLTIAAIKRLELSLKKEESLSKLHDLEVKLQNLNEKESKITEMFTSELINANTYEASLQSMKKNRHDIELQIMEIKNAIGDKSDFDRHVETLRKVLNQELTHNEFESLLNESVKRINVTPECVEVITIYGSVKINRQMIFRNYNFCPHYWFNIASGKNSDKTYTMNLIFYYGEEEAEPDITSERELLADFNELKIWVRK